MLRYRTKYGTTLMETICVLAIFGVIAATGTAIAFPSLVSKQRATVESSNLANSLRMARQQAITSQQPITVRFQRQGATVVSYTIGSLDGQHVSKQFIENDVLVSTDATSVIFKAGGTTNRDLSCTVESDTRTVFIFVRAISGTVTMKNG